MTNEGKPCEMYYLIRLRKSISRDGLLTEIRTVGGAAIRPLAEARDAAERAQIAAALSFTGGQVAEAARLLRVSRTTLWEKMQKLGL